MSKIDKVRESGKEFVLSMIEQHGMDKTALFFGYVRPDGSGNGGVISNILKDEGWRNGGEQKTTNPVVQKKTAAEIGYLPGRVADWTMRKLGMEPDDGDTLPDDFCPADFLDLPDVAAESTNYLRLVSRLEPEKELNPFRHWLGTGLTRAERAIEAVQAQIARIAQIDAGLATAENRFNAMRYDAAITAFYAE